MSKFTQGPWNKDNRSENLVGSSGKNVVVYDSGLSFAGLPSDESQANARLIAAAPEMYEALKLAKKEMIASGNWFAKDYDWPKAQMAVEAALAKADGKPNPAPPANPPA